MSITAESISLFITETFDGVDPVVAGGTTFFMYDPERNLPDNRRFPFATLITDDEHDRASNLARPGVFRLNIGVSKPTYRSMFGDPPPPVTAVDQYVATGHDFTTLDQIMPHPVYASYSWVCVLNPSDATWERIKELLAEAYQKAVKRITNPSINDESER